MLLAELVKTSEHVARTPKRLDKIDILVRCLVEVERAEAGILVAYLCGQLPQSRPGVGPQLLLSIQAPKAGSSRLTLLDVDQALERTSQASGPGSRQAKGHLLQELLSRATGSEQDFLRRLILGELRQGALEGVLLDAVSKATRIPMSRLHRALLVAGNTRTVAEAALTGGAEHLSTFRLQVMQPLAPMLAQPAPSAVDALTKFQSPFVEYKIDGARIQVHKQGQDVRVYSRNLREVTAAAPEIVESARALPAAELILDGEVAALDRTGVPLPFQTTMRRFGRKLEAGPLRSELPLSWFCFDCLHASGDDLVDLPYEERIQVLDSIVPPQQRVARERPETAARLESFFERALSLGYEGAMIKSASAVYEPGRRGGAWLKLKPAHTLDLVVLAAEWGSGRRMGWLSNLHLGARDPNTNSFIMLGKTFKGLTDELLRYQTEALLGLQVSRDPHTVVVRPELVVEIAFSDVQSSPQYPAGLALRFARVKRYRPDKSAAAADTIDTVRALHHTGHRARV